LRHCSTLRRLALCSLVPLLLWPHRSPAEPQRMAMLRRPAVPPQATAAPLAGGRLTEQGELRRLSCASALARDSLMHAAIECGVPRDIALRVVELMQKRAEPAGRLRRGDSFVVLYTDGVQGRLLHSASLLLRDRLIAVFRSPSGDAFYDEQGRVLRSLVFHPPVRNARLTSGYSRRRIHPLLGVVRPHLGIDLAAPRGTSVHAAAAGAVSEVRYSRSGGYIITLDHESGYRTRYLHLAAPPRSLRKGVRIARGQVIGRVGATGLATGPHLHFELHQGLQSVDPLRAGLPLHAADERLPQGYLAKIVARLKAEHRLLRSSST